MSFLDNIGLSPLNKKEHYIDKYTSSLLFPIPRSLKRQEMGITEPLPFFGFDDWSAYEISWLNSKGKPVVAVGEFRFPCASPNIIESKSFKLYLNSFNMSPFDSIDDVHQTLTQDLSRAAGAPVRVKLTAANEFHLDNIGVFHGESLDKLDVVCNEYHPNPNFLFCEEQSIEETLYSELLKSNCLVTGSPDWASLQIQYTGKKINHEALLRYIVSFRDHSDLHEQCLERIFHDIKQQCQPTKLTVYACYTRRGGLDINSYRSTSAEQYPAFTQRLFRQ